MKTPTIFYSHIVATAQNSTIGMKGILPWHIPEDLNFFHTKTKNKITIMGRKTFESLKQALPGRLNIVISRNVHYSVPKGVLLYPSLDKAYQFCNKQSKKLTLTWGNEVFIIGGGEIYKQSLSKVTFIYLTRIHKDYSGDVTYPYVPKTHFKEINRIDRSGHPDYSFITYKKIKK